MEFNNDRAEDDDDDEVEEPNQPDWGVAWDEVRDFIQNASHQVSQGIDQIQSLAQSHPQSAARLESLMQGTPEEQSRASNLLLLAQRENIPAFLELPPHTARVMDTLLAGNEAQARTANAIMSLNRSEYAPDRQSATTMLRLVGGGNTELAERLALMGDGEQRRQLCQMVSDGNVAGADYVRGLLSGARTLDTANSLLENLASPSAFLRDGATAMLRVLGEQSEGAPSDRNTFMRNMIATLPDSWTRDANYNDPALNRAALRADALELFSDQSTRPVAEQLRTMLAGSMNHQLAAESFLRARRQAVSPEMRSALDSMLTNERERPALSAALTRLPDNEVQNLMKLQTGTGTERAIAASLTELLQSADTHNQQIASRLLSSPADAAARRLMEELANPSTRADALDLARSVSTTREIQTFMELRTDNPTQAAEVLSMLRGNVNSRIAANQILSIGNASGASQLLNLPPEHRRAVLSQGPDEARRLTRMLAGNATEQDTGNSILSAITRGHGAAAIDTSARGSLAGVDEYAARDALSRESPAETRQLLELSANPEMRRASRALSNMLGSEEPQTAASGRALLEMVSSTNRSNQEQGRWLLNQLNNSNERTQQVGQELLRLPEEQRNGVYNLLRAGGPAAGQIEDMLVNSSRSAIPLENLNDLLINPNLGAERERILTMLNQPGNGPDSEAQRARDLLSRTTNGAQAAQLIRLQESAPHAARQINDLLRSNNQSERAGALALLDSFIRRPTPDNGKQALFRPGPDASLGAPPEPIQRIIETLNSQRAEDRNLGNSIVRNFDSAIAQAAAFSSLSQEGPVAGQIRDLLLGDADAQRLAANLQRMGAGSGIAAQTRLLSALSNPRTDSEVNLARAIRSARTPAELNTLSLLMVPPYSEQGPNEASSTLDRVTRLYQRDPAAAAEIVRNIPNRESLRTFTELTESEATRAEAQQLLALIQADETSALGNYILRLRADATTADAGRRMAQLAETDFESALRISNAGIVNRELPALLQILEGPGGSHVSSLLNENVDLVRNLLAAQNDPVQRAQARHILSLFTAASSEAEGDRLAARLVPPPSRGIFGGAKS